MNHSEKETVLDGNGYDLHLSRPLPEEDRKNITVVRAQIDNGDIKIITHLEKDLALAELTQATESVLMQDLHHTLVREPDPEDEQAEKATIGFLYIGNNSETYKYLISQFSFGYKRRSLEEAGQYSLQLYMQNKRLPDVMFIDLPLSEASLNDFCSKLRHNILLSNLPLIYSEDQLSDEQIDKLAGMQLIDDIFNLSSPEIDYFSKAMFLKQCKLYNHTIHVARSVLTKKKTFRRSLSLFLKRAMDVTLASLALIGLLPLLILIALAIKIDSRGPVFYTSLRAGRGFKVFRFFKFRSMVPGAEKVVENMAHLNQYGSEEGPKFFKVSKDPRVTKFGKFMRNTSVDELPQLLNVLKGDMSIVGNRPLPLYEAVSLTTDEFVERFSAPAGITGLWQVNKRGKAEMSSEERIHLDITYSRRYSFLYDLRIMAKTPVALLQKSDV